PARSRTATGSRSFALASHLIPSAQYTGLVPNQMFSSHTHLVLASPQSPWGAGMAVNIDVVGVAGKFWSNPFWTSLAYGVGAVAYGVKDNGFAYFLLLFYSQGHR